MQALALCQDLALGLGLRSVDPDRVISSLFAAGEQGIWLDPSDLSTMFQDAAGTTPVTADGQPVGLIRDKSGRGNHASQATTASKPVYKTDGTLRWLQFDGTDDYLTTAAVNLSGGDKVTHIVGVESISDTGNQQAFVEFGALPISNPGIFAAYWNRADTTFAAFSRGTASITGGQGATKSSPITTKALMVATHDISGSRSTMRFNGAAVPDGTASKGSGNFGNYSFYVGRRGGTSIPLSGKFYGTIARAGLTADPMLPQAERWMAAKMGLTL